MKESLNIVVAFCKGFGIGNNNSLPWRIKEDLVYFEKVTSVPNSFVIMGRKTFFSIPAEKRPLKNRFNVVVTNNPANYKEFTNESTSFVPLDDLKTSLLPVLFTMFKNGFIIGGEQLFKAFVFLPIDKIYVTFIDKEYKCDTVFPFESYCSSFDYNLNSYSPWYYSEGEKCNYRHLEYTRISPLKSLKKHDTVYTSLLTDILGNGEHRPDRTGTGTLSVFAKQLKFNIEEDVPLLTTKYVPWKSVIKELLWFLQGNTDANKLEGTKIWQGNTSRDFLDKRGLVHYKEGDIGPMYGFQWRHFGADYRGCDANYEKLGIDQLENVINLLKTDPFSRRILMTTVNVNDLEKGCLHPCHGIVVQFYVTQTNKLSCHMYQRSVDTFLGLTWNIMSYAVLTYIIAKKVDMIPHELIISTGDTHLYVDHIEQAKQQISRTPYPSPKLILTDDIKNKDFKDITINDFEVIGYLYHPAIRAKMSV